MKRTLRKSGLLSVLLALMLLVVGCGVKTTDTTEATDAPDAKSVYTSAVEQTQKLESMDCTIQMNMSMSYEGKLYDVKIALDVKAENVSSAADMKMSMNMLYDIDTLGSYDMDMYYGDGYVFMEMQGVKMKAAVSSDQFEGGSQGVVDISADFLSDLKTEEDGDNTIVSYSCSGEGLTELMNQIQSVGTDSSTYEGMSIDSAEGTIVINKDGYVISQTLDMVMNYDDNGTVSTFDMQMVVTYNNPGKDVTVEMPDASDYTEVDASNLGY